MKKIAVIGGGLSGLSTAYIITRLAEEANKDVEVTIIEADRRLGGKIRSDIVDKYVCEYGPSGFLDNKPDTITLVDDLDLRGKIVKSNPEAKKRYIYSENILHKLPEKPGEFFKSKLLTTKGKLRILKEPFTKPADPDIDETIFSFGERHLGEEAAAKLIDSMAAGIFAGKADELSLKACFPVMADLEKLGNGSLIKAMIKRMKAAKKARQKGAVAAAARTEPGGNLLTFDHGMETLVDTLAGRFHHQIEHVAVTGIERTSNFQVHKADGTATEADAVVLAIPAYAAANIARDLIKDAAEAMDEIPYVPISVITLGYDQNGFDANVDGFGFLTPSAERRKILGTLWTSSTFDGQAPSDHISLRTMVGGARNPELAYLDDTELTRLVQDELLQIMGLTAEPEFTKIFRHDKAIPQYTVGHLERVSRVDENVEKIPGLYVTGNAFKGVGVNDCIANANIVAKRIVEEL